MPNKPVVDNITYLNHVGKARKRVSTRYTKYMLLQQKGQWLQPNHAKKTIHPHQTINFTPFPKKNEPMDLYFSLSDYNFIHVADRLSYEKTRNNRYCTAIGKFTFCKDRNRVIFHEWSAHGFDIWSRTGSP
jgi:hypothetical protein